MNQLTREDLYRLTNLWHVPAPLDRIMVGGAWAESHWDADAERDQVAGVVHSIGLFRLHDRGHGKGLTAQERRDPNIQFSVMTPEYRRAYAYWSNPQAHGQGDLPLDEIAWRTCAWAERPFNYQDPESLAATHYRRGWDMAAEDRRRPDHANRVYPFTPRAQYESAHWDRGQALDVFDLYGAPVLACADGQIYYHAYPQAGWTATLTADTDDEEGAAVYFHAHLVIGSGLVPQGGGTRCIAGQEIGRVGDSGNIAGKPPHCHWAAATRAYGVDYDGAGNVAGAALLDVWAAHEGSEEVTNTDLANLVDHLTHDTADTLQTALDEVRACCTEAAAAEPLERLQAAIDSLKGVQSGGDDMATESVREQMQGYRGTPMREPRPEIEGPDAGAEREAAEQAAADSPEARHRTRLAEEFGVPEEEISTDMVRDAVAHENEANARKQEPTAGVAEQTTPQPSQAPVGEAPPPEMEQKGAHTAHAETQASHGAPPPQQPEVPSKEGAPSPEQEQQEHKPEDDDADDEDEQPPEKGDGPGQAPARDGRRRRG